MEAAVMSSPQSSPNLSALLKIKIITWSQETGLPVSVRVQVAGKILSLHKLPLMSKSGYFRRELEETSEIDLPSNFPGGFETFEMIILFMYTSSTFIDPFNVASLRCAAEFLEMSESYSSSNLIERTDLYLNRVVFQSWDDTLIVLQKCRSLPPWAEQLLVVSRCIESLAFMACMEILDPDRKRDPPVFSLESLASRPWSTDAVIRIVSQDLWVKDLIALPFAFFKRIIGSLRRQGMNEKYASPIIVFYANKWVLSRKTRRFWECLCEENGDDDAKTETKSLEVLQGVLDLLPVSEKATRVIPVGFYFAILARALQLGLQAEGMKKLQDLIVLLLPLAHVEDFLNGHDLSVSMMESIFSSYVSSKVEAENMSSISTSNSIVAELWDMYISRMAEDPSTRLKRFMSLIEIVPVSWRQNHDYLYKAVNFYLQAHPNITQEEKGSICKYLNCQKLSQEVCIEAVQNEFMPIRLIVQALFVQQLHTQTAFKECSESFRCTYSAEFSGSLSSSRYPNSKSHNLDESPFMDRDEPDELRKECESASFRIQNLEQEFTSLKKTIHLQKPTTSSLEPNGLDGRSSSKSREAWGQVTGCVSSVNFISQRKYAGRILRIIRRITLFGRGKPKRKPSASGS